MRDIRRTIHIKSTREEVFNAITNPLTIELWSGYPAIIEASVEEPAMIEQEWDFGDQPFASIVRLELSEEAGKTKIELLHTNVPDEAYDNISTGWKDSYLGALKSYLEN